MTRACLFVTTRRALVKNIILSAGRRVLGGIFNVAVTRAGKRPNTSNGVGSPAIRRVANVFHFSSAKRTESKGVNVRHMTIFFCPHTRADVCPNWYQNRVISFKSCNNNTPVPPPPPRQIVLKIIFFFFSIVSYHYFLKYLDFRLLSMHVYFVRWT